MSYLIEGAADLTILVLLAFVAMPFLRRQPAALRHFVLAVTLIGGAVLPFVAPVVPGWRLPVQMSAPVRVTAPMERPPATAAEAPSQGTEPGPVQTAEPTPIFRIVMWAWATGVVGGMGVLLFGFARLRRLACTARHLAEPRWQRQAASISRELGLRQPVTLLESREPHLVVWGVLRPRVLLPAVARDWSDARVRVVLTHELAHIRRGDWVVQCVTELLRALYWFNPLLWTACARLRRESDLACDDIVIACGVEGSDYAAHLLDIAHVLRHERAWIPAPAIAHTTGFERRVQAMLNSNLDRRPVSRRTCATTLAAFLSLALPLAAFTATQTALVSFTGSVVDPSNAVLPNAVVTLTNTETLAKYEVRTNRDGRYEIPGLPAGPYVLESRLPGFKTVKLELTVGGENVQRDLKLELGSLQETITIAHGGIAEPRREMTPEQKAKLEERLRQRAAQTCGDGAGTTPATGGNIRVPVKLRDVRPIYPADLATTGVSGKVVLLAVIGTDGRVQDITVESASHGEFAAAAMDAVRQWEFDATLLNCVPVETRMTVTANFVQR